MSATVEKGMHPFLPIETKGLEHFQYSPATLLDNKRIPSWIQQYSLCANLPYLDLGQLDVFSWPNPLDHIPNEPYPSKLRSFTPTICNPQDRDIALRLLEKHGPFIGLHRSEHNASFIDHLRQIQSTVKYFVIPEHQARGFHYDAIAFWHTTTGQYRLTSTVCTKGNGTTGYWVERRRKEMMKALQNEDYAYPLNPDPIHARDHTGQSVGQKEGDEIVLVGAASATVTKREVEGFQIYTESNIFAPICMSPRVIQELPLGSGEVIPSRKFLSSFASNELLVYLAKAWGNELRIWKNHFDNRFMTATHLLSAQENGEWIFEQVLNDLQSTCFQRKQLLQLDEERTRNMLQQIPKDHWDAIIGPAAISLRSDTISDDNGSKPIIPHILSLNMIENTAQVAIHRLWGKPVAWHLENIGRWGEVSGGERIYGKNATGIPSGIERHFFFACLFDGYMATAIEWAATNPTEYMPLSDHYRKVRLKTLNTNPQHWLQVCPTIEALISFCQQEKPEYEVKFRSEDTYPLVAIPGTTALECIDNESNGSWKKWNVIMNNASIFLHQIHSIYSTTNC